VVRAEILPVARSQAGRVRDSLQRGQGVARCLIR
jgi:hypothetical protein